MRLHQSDLKTWSKCPLMWRWENVDNLPRLQSASLTYGSILHWCVEHMEKSGDVENAVAWFLWYWDDPTRLDPTYKIQYYVKGTTWKKYRDDGPHLLRDWGEHMRWGSNKVLAREHHFIVPIGDGHELEGTADKIELRYDPRLDRMVLVIVDYKSNKKVPTYEYLEEDLQFTAYGYASTRPEFWTGIQNGEQIWRELQDTPRYGEWVSLPANKRMDAGVRTEQQFNRLIYAVNAMAESVAMRIFVPTITGESCRYCDFRKQCGMPELDDDGNPKAA